MKKILLSIILCLLFALPAQADLTVDQVVWWNFNSASLLDTGGDGNNYTLTAFGSALVTEEGWDGLANGAVHLNGSDQYFAVPAPNINAATGDVSVSIHFKYDAVGADYLYRSPGIEIHSEFGTDDLKCIINTTSGSVDYVINNSPLSDTWYSVIIVKVGSSLKVYLDGNLTPVVDVTLPGDTLVTSGANVTIGYFSGAFPNLHDGGVDDFGVWSRGLTDPEITELATGVLPSSISIDEVATGDKVGPYDANEEYSQALTGTYVEALTNPEIRVFRDDNDATVQVNGNDWNVLSSQVVDSGVWSGTLAGIPKTNGWLRFEVRKSNETEITGETTSLFGVGYLMLLEGQSNAAMMSTVSTGTPNDLTRKYDGSWVTNTGAGAISLANQLVSYLNCPVGIVNAGVGGAALLELNNLGYGWFFEGNTSANYTALKALIAGVGGAVNSVMRYQDETDILGTMTNYQATEILYLADQLRTDIVSASQTTLPILVCLHGRWSITDSITDESWTDSTDKKIENWEAGHFNGIITAIDQVEGALKGHLDGPEYATIGLRMARWASYIEGIYATYRGPVLTSVESVDNETTDATFSLDYGTDIAPSSGIDSIDANIGTIETPNWVSATGVRLNANTVRLTHATGPAVELRTMYGQFFNQAPSANMLRDNSALALPALQTSGVAIPVNILNWMGAELKSIGGIPVENLQSWAGMTLQ